MLLGDSSMLELIKSEKVAGKPITSMAGVTTCFGLETSQLPRVYVRITGRADEPGSSFFCALASARRSTCCSEVLTTSPRPRPQENAGLLGFES